MRTPIFALLLTFASWSTTLTQTERGVYSLGGSISFASSKTSYSLYESNTYESTTTVLSLSPTCSYFVLDHLEITLAPAYETADAPASTLFPGGSVTDVAVRLGFRYYYPLEDFALFVGPSGGLSWSKVGGSYSSPTTTYMVEGGMDYFLTRTAAVEPSIRYSSTDFSNMTLTQFSVGIGIKYFIL